MDEKRISEILLRILKYIENNLNNPISLDEIAKSACLSKYHLHRLMKDFLEEPLISYITRIRMERALMYLKISSKTILEIANEVGYESVTSFIKAFKKRFGVSPKALVAGFKFENLSLNGSLSIAETTYLDKTYVLYIPVLGNYGASKFDEAWSKLIDYAKRNNILNEKTRYLGIYFDDPKITQENKCRAYLCITVEEEIKVNSPYISRLELDSGFYSVYTFQGKYSELTNVYDCIFHREIPHVNAYKTHFEEYLSCEEFLPPITRIYIPIIKKSKTG